MKIEIQAWNDYSYDPDTKRYQGRYIGIALDNPRFVVGYEVFEQDSHFLLESKNAFGEAIVVPCKSVMEIHNNGDMKLLSMLRSI